MCGTVRLLFGALEACAAAGSALKPLKLDVGVSGGVDAAGHALQSASTEDDRALALLLDAEESPPQRGPRSSLFNCAR